MNPTGNLADGDIRHAQPRFPLGLLHYHEVARKVIPEFVKTRELAHLDSANRKTLETVVSVLVGARDQGSLGAADYDYMERKIPDIEKVIIENGGHAANLDQPEVFNKLLMTFLDQLEKSDRVKCAE